MSTFDDLFKSETEEAALDCPHCNKGIRKSDILAKSKNAPRDAAVKQNSENQRATAAHNDKTPTRTAPGVPATQPIPGNYKKADGGSPDGSDDQSSPEMQMAKKSFSLFGWENSGVDNYIRKSVEERTLGGNVTTQPINGKLK